MDTILRLQSGLVITLAIDAQTHTLALSAKDELRGLSVSFLARDHIDNRRSLSCFQRLPNDQTGRMWFFHEKTRMDSYPNAVELHTCPVEEETNAPIPALMAHYRFEAVPGQDCLRITAWFTSPSTVIADSLSWLQLQPEETPFRAFTGFSPAYSGSLAKMKHPMRFGSLAVSGETGWAAWMECGEAIWIPSFPNYAPDEIERTEAMRNMGIFAPQATTCQDVDLCAYSESHPLTATLVFGTGQPLLPLLPEAPPPPPSQHMEGERHVLQSGTLCAGVTARKDGISPMGISLDDFHLTEDAPMVPL